MNIFEFDDYKVFVRENIKRYPRGGHGQYLKIAQLLAIHTTMVTHIFRGNSDLTPEQGVKLAQYFALAELETDYFVILIQKQRSANPEGRAYFEKHRQTLKTRALKIGERIQVQENLDTKDQAIFYSAWYYSAIRLLTAIHEFKSAEMIAEFINLPLPVVVRAVEFLLRTGLLKEEKGRLVVGETKTFLDRESPFANKHHINWRMKSLEQLDHVPAEDFVFTNSIAISQKDFLRVREELIKFVKTYTEIGDPSPSEQLCYINIDWRKLQLRN